MESKSELSPATHLEESPDPAYCLCEVCMIPLCDTFSQTSRLLLSKVDNEGGHISSTLLAGPGVQPHTQCDSGPTSSIMQATPFTLGLSTTLTSLTSAPFRLPEVLPLSITPYATAEADSDTRWVHQGEAIYKEIVDAIANDCFIYLYNGMLYNMPAVPGESGPYYCVTHGQYIGVFNTWNEVMENIKGFSDVAYAVTSLAIGEALLHTAIRKGEVRKCRV
ncbi:hypothetical protein DFJ58DRAFT_839594 [Suillus subalutaceus]|uniref:uncharacterized protein n=1 Tax=Suillus subalutaceus TaxID=48586 RepID=UPI001B870F8A|nr:uncharacterized protein DFJ58DRAFT_839594 [Suillus subalutaceus]KAG1861763.1 hypothetical protein DFJ58DRAFT_839594 [Suillus subalutaceus]